MFKSLLIIILVAVALWAARSLSLRIKNTTRDTQNTDSENAKNSKKMLQCAHCHTYIPSDEAIIKDNKSFCSAQHLEEWNKSA